MTDTTKDKYTVLVVEDDAAMREMLVESLAEEGYRLRSAQNGREGVAAVRGEEIDLVVTDLRMHDMDGLDMIREIRTLADPPSVITITAFGSIDTAIRAVKLGAFDYITKPFEVDQLLIAVDRALRDGELRSEVARLREAVADRYGFDNIIGRSPAMMEVFELIRRVADAGVSVLITGDSGTGKELVARALHYNSSRRDGPFIAINCAAIPETLLESELFGYKRGAFTDAVADRKGMITEAHGGTLFLDEIGELPTALQAKLLRVLQERELRPVGSSTPERVEVRFIAATNRKLEPMLEAGAFRRDLYYRLNVVQISIPPLRDRTEDILPLASHLLRQAVARAKKPIQGLSSDAAKALLAHDWPGNVRELENVLERAVALSRGPAIELADLPRELLRLPSAEDMVTRAASRQMTLAELEQHYIMRVLTEEQGNKTRAAQRLGLDRKTLYRKLEEYRKESGLPPSAADSRTQTRDG